MPVDENGKFTPWEETEVGKYYMSRGLKRSDVTFIFAYEYMYDHVDNFALATFTHANLIMASIIFEDEFEKDFPDEVWVTRVGVVYDEPIIQIKQTEEDCAIRKITAFMNWLAIKYPEFLERGEDENKRFLGYSNYHMTVLMKEKVEERLKSGKYVISPGEWFNPEDDPTDKEHYIEKPEVDPTKLPTEEELYARWKKRFGEWLKTAKKAEEYSETAKKFAAIPTVVASDAMYEEWARIAEAF